MVVARVSLPVYANELFLALIKVPETGNQERWPHWRLDGGVWVFNAPSWQTLPGHSWLERRMNDIN